MRILFKTEETRKPKVTASRGAVVRNNLFTVVGAAYSLRRCSCRGGCFSGRGSRSFGFYFRAHCANFGTGRQLRQFPTVVTWGRLTPTVVTWGRLTRMPLTNRPFRSSPIDLDLILLGKRVAKNAPGPKVTSAGKRLPKPVLQAAAISEWLGEPGVLKDPICPPPPPPLVTGCVYLRYYLTYFSEYLIELLVPLTFILYLALLITKALQPSCHPELLCILVSFVVAAATAACLQLAEEVYFGLWQFLFFTICFPLYICLT
jgi:hypothetical protein